MLKKKKVKKRIKRDRAIEFFTVESTESETVKKKKKEKKSIKKKNKLKRSKISKSDEAQALQAIDDSSVCVRDGWCNYRCTVLVTVG